MKSLSMLQPLCLAVDESEGRTHEMRKHPSGLT